MASAFSTLQDAPEAAGVTREEAQASDHELNTAQFGVPDPQAVLQELSSQFDRAPAAQVDPDVLKRGYVVLDAAREGSQELATHYADSIAAAAAGQPADSTAGVLQASHLADAAALRRAQELVADLAAELGISLPVGRGNHRQP